MPLQKLSGSALNAFYAELATTGSQRRLGGLSAATVRRVHAVLHRALRDAVRWDRVVRNAAELADPPRQRATAAREMTAWSAEEVERFLDFAETDRLYALWVVLLSTGVRRGETIGLPWQDVDFETARAAIRQTLVTVGYEVVIVEPKTSRSKRVVALDLETVAILKAHRRAQMEERLMRGAAWHESGMVFVRADGSPLHPDRVTKLFEGLVERSSLPRIRLHDTRHTHATLALRAGVHPKVVSDRLGHSSTTVTLDTYSHVVPGLQEEAASVVASLFLKPKVGRPAIDEGER